MNRLRDFGWGNFVYLLLMLALFAAEASGAMRTVVVGGLLSVTFLLVNMGRLASAMANAKPAMQAVIGVALPLLCGLVLMQLAAGRLGG